MIDPEYLRSILRYDLESGKLFWLPRVCGVPSETKRWNARYAGREAGSLGARGYVVVHVLGKLRPAHRVSWAIHTGQWPQNEIDHVNGQKADNRILNLREATKSQNLKNSRSRLGSLSKFIGVSWDNESQQWRARIKANGRHKYLGRFKSEEDAARAYDVAAIAEHGEFARPNFPLAGGELLKLQKLNNSNGKSTRSTTR